MATTLLSPGPQYNILQNVVYALPGSPCNIVLGTACERGPALAGPFVGWTGGYNHVGGFIRCTTGGTTYKATKLKMKELDQYYGSIVMNDRPSYRWALDEVSGTIAVDSVGGANGTISGGVTLNQAGVLGKGMLFNGTTGKILTDNPAPFPITVTVEAWIKTSDSVTQKTILSNRHNVVGGSSRIAFYMVGAAGVWTGIGTNGVRNISDNQWHHVVFILDGTNCKIYIDGVLDVTGTNVVTLPNLNLLSIGWETEGNQWFNGSLDEIAIYPYALSPSQIQSHYLSRFGVIGSAYASKVVMSGPSNYWRLNETSGLTARDSAGTANGTISGGVVLNGEGGMTFNGSTGKINISSITIPVISTIEGWIKTTSTAQIPLITLHPTNGTFIGAMNGFIRVVSQNSIIGTRPIADGNWHHIITLLNSTTCTIYVDGTLDISGANPRVAPDTTPEEIGYITAYNLFMNGQIDDVAIYPRALTPAEILDHYNSR